MKNSFEDLTLEKSEKNLANELNALNPNKPKEYKNLDKIIEEINKSLSDNDFEKYKKTTQHLN